MKNIETNSKTVLDTTPRSENQKGIDNYKKVITHFEAATKSHIDASKHYESGNHEKVAKCIVDTYGYSCVANNGQEDIKHHTAKF